ncbi:MAG: sigma-70 family RNA polymerase sigma factor [Chloroflexi bacterium]|nr:sigma-70 family RNA polymerase sigma factor [Chloroflexota bacterium]
MADKQDVTRVDEGRLIRRARQGDADAFACLYQETVQAVYRYIYLRVNDTQLAEDMTGDVYMRALKAMGSYQEQGKPFIAWLYRIAHARVVDHYRRTDRRPVESDIEAEPIPVSADMDHSLLRRQAAKALREAIAQLTDEQQQVVILRFIEGHSLETAAQIMGKNANAIKALQHRALRSLAGRLARAGFDVEAILAGLSS